MADLLIAHVEIPVTNLEKSKAFFDKIFNWNFKPFGNGYLLFNNHQGIMVGLRQVEKTSTGDTTVFHVNVKKIDEVLSSAEKNGGSIKRGKTVIPAMGWYALLTDPDGNTIGLYQKN
jgi:uncharacterized protein